MHVCVCLYISHAFLSLRKALGEIFSMGFLLFVLTAQFQETKIHSKR